MMDSRPGEAYLLNLHLPAPQQSENLETLRYFLGKAVGAIKAGKTGDAARYMGTVCHMLEDYGCPAHTVPGDNMFTLLQQFLPPPERMKGTLLHGPIESGKLDVAIKGYRPRLLGTTAEEAAWRCSIVPTKRSSMPAPRPSPSSRRSMPMILKRWSPGR